MKVMPLLNRFIGSVIDKVLILFIFVVGFFIIEGEYSGMGRSITYLSLAPHTPSEYAYITLNSLYIIDRGYPLKYSNKSEQEILEEYMGTDVQGIVTSFDLTITFTFILLNILFYLLSEIFLGASVGKALLRGRLVDNLLSERIETSAAFKRAIIGGLLMSLAVGLRFLFDTNYIITIVLFFVIIDTPLFFKGRSLIDMFSKVTYVKRLSNDSKENTVSVVDEMKVIPIENVTMPEVKTVKAAKTQKKWNFHIPRIPQVKLEGLRDNKQMKKASLYLYLIWLAVNIIALAYSMAYQNRLEPEQDFGSEFFGDSPKKTTHYFYPTETPDIEDYDFSEFVVYTVALPLCLFAIVKLILLFVPRKSTN